MERKDAEEYTQALGEIFSGSWRLIFHAERQGIPAALEMSTREWVEERLGGYVRMSIPERREAVGELTEGEGLSNVEAAGVLGVGETTVRRDRATSPNGEPESGEQIAPEAEPSPNGEPESTRLGHEPQKQKPAAPPREEVDLFEVFKCPGCGYKGERPEFRMKGGAE